MIAAIRRRGDITVKVVAALIAENGKFMICRRPEGKARASLWEFVGGKVEKGETEERALIRECREELGTEISVGEEFARVNYDYPDISVELAVYTARITGGAPTALEHSEIRWITPEETVEYEFCPADADVLEKIRRTGIA